MPWPLVVVEADSGAIPNALEMPSANEPTPMAPEEYPGIITGMGHRENHPPVTTPKDQDPEKGGGALPPGMNIAGCVIGQLENLLQLWSFQ